MFHVFRIHWVLFAIFSVLGFSGLAASEAHAASVGGASPPQMQVMEENHLPPEKRLKQDYTVPPIPFQIVLDPVSPIEKNAQAIRRKGGMTLYILMIIFISHMNIQHYFLIKTVCVP